MHQYGLGASCLETVLQKRDLGVLVDINFDLLGLSFHALSVGWVIPSVSL